MFLLLQHKLEEQQNENGAAGSDQVINMVLNAIDSINQRLNSLANINASEKVNYFDKIIKPYLVI